MRFDLLKTYKAVKAVVFQSQNKVSLCQGDYKGDLVSQEIQETQESRVKTDIFSILC